MSRALTTDMVTQVKALQLIPVVLMKAEFDSGALLLWSGIGSMIFNGDTYAGAGNLLGVSEINEVTGVEAQGATMVLSGVPASFISMALTEDYTSRPITIYFGALYDDLTLVPDPVILYKGRMDVMQIDEGGDSATISMQSESRLIDLRRSKVRRYTPEDQKTTYPNDRGLDFVAALQEKEIVWGRKSP